MRIIKTTLVAGLISVLSIFSAQAEKVKIGDPGWTGATAIANLLAAVVTDKMGGEAELVPGNNTAIYAAIDRGKGEIDDEPYLRFKGTKYEQETFFVKDPNENILEIKTLTSNPD